MGTRQEQASQWLGEVARWRASGLSRAAYCAREGLSVSAFGYWVSKANRGVQAPAPLTLVAGQPQWLSAPAPIEAGTGGLTLRTPEGWHLSFAQCPSAAWLCELLAGANR